MILLWAFAVTRKANLEPSHTKAQTCKLQAQTSTYPAEVLIHVKRVDIVWGGHLWNCGLLSSGGARRRLRHLPTNVLPKNALPGCSPLRCESCHQAVPSGCLLEVWPDLCRCRRECCSVAVKLLQPNTSSQTGITVKHAHAHTSACRRTQNRRHIHTNTDT